MEEQAYIPLISYRSKLARYPRPWTVNFELHDMTLRWCKAHVTLSQGIAHVAVKSYRSSGDLSSNIRSPNSTCSDQNWTSN